MPHPVAHEGNRVLDHFETFQAFEDCLRLAGDGGRRIADREFLRGINSRWKQYGKGLYLSANQAAWLKDLAAKAE